VQADLQRRVDPPDRAARRMSSTRQLWKLACRRKARQARSTRACRTSCAPSTRARSRRGPVGAPSAHSIPAHHDPAGSVRWVWCQLACCASHRPQQSEGGSYRRHCSRTGCACSNMPSVDGRAELRAGPYAGICESRITQFSIPRLNASRELGGPPRSSCFGRRERPTKEIPQCAIIT
jgi:hypothetical protein